MKLITFLKKLIDNILDIAFPKTNFEKKLSKITAEDLYSKSIRIKNINNKIITIFSYENNLIKKTIHSLKFKKNKKFAKIFAQILYDELLENLSERELFSNFRKPILIPIPLSKQRLRERGFNQCELIAKEMNILDGNTSFAFKKNVLIKIKNTPPQSLTKNKKERLENLKNCFGIKNPEKIKNRNIIILDDITTTGTTLKEAEKTLHKHGAKKIIYLTIAH